MRKSVFRLLVFGLFELISAIQTTGAVINEGESATLKCRIGSSSPMSVSWTKTSDNEDSPTIYHYVSSTASRGITDEFRGRWEVASDASFDIRLLNGDRRDNGTYACIVVTASGAEVSNADLLVKVPPTKPIIVEPSDFKLILGEPGKLRCKSEDGIPNPKYIWYKNNQQLAERGKNFTIREDPLNNNDRVIHFSHVTEADAGMYHCVAKSSAGEAMGSPVEITTGSVSVASVVGIVFGVIFGVALLCVIGFMAIKRMNGGSEDDYDEDDDDAADVMISDTHYGGGDFASGGYGGNTNRAEASLVV